MRQCTRCKQQKPIIGFYKQNLMADGYMRICKECIKKASRVREKELRKDPDWVAVERERGRERYYRVGDRFRVKTKKQDRDRTVNYRTKFPEKYKATQATINIKCSRWENKHHWSYQKEHWLDFIVLKKKLHYKLHRYLKYIPEKKMYQTLEGNLLDTREKHEAFIEQVKPH